MGYPGAITGAKHGSLCWFFLWQGYQLPADSLEEETIEEVLKVLIDKYQNLNFQITCSSFIVGGPMTPWVDKKHFDTSSEYLLLWLKSHGQNIAHNCMILTLKICPYHECYGPATDQLLLLS